MHQPIIDAVENQRLRTMPNSFLPPSLQGHTSRRSIFSFANAHHESSAWSAQGVILVGDAYNMRHPLTGGGMTVAFNDAVLLAELLGPGRFDSLHDLRDWDEVSNALKEWFWRRKNVAGVVNVLSMALYDLFGGADREHDPCRHRMVLTCAEPDLEILREGCFRYFELGGDCIAGPVGLLSA
jgi:squalene monooxygenase